MYENTKTPIAFTCTLSSTITNITQARALFFLETAVHTLNAAAYWKQKQYSKIALFEFSILYYSKI